MKMGTLDTLQNGQVAGDSSIPKKINSLLNSPKTRNEGLELLNVFLPQCPDEDFLQFCISWMQNCCKIDSLTKIKDHAIHLLSDLFKTSSNFQELKKSVSFFITTRYFDFFFKHLLHSQAGWSCTETCLLMYRGACGPFQENLGKQLESEIGRDVKISSTIAHCYALFPSAGGGGNEGICYVKNWKSQFVKFLNIGHSLLEDLFADVEELQEYPTPEHTYDKTRYENTPAYLAIQLHNHCSVLNSMLLCQYPSPKTIPTDLIFQLICRGLAVTSKALAKRQTTNIMSVQKALPEVHCCLLSLLKAVIVTCKTQLLPYSHLICKLISQTLEGTESEQSCKNEKTVGLLRVSAYEVLCNWLAVSRSGSCSESISSVVISSAVGDILAKKKVVTLKEAKRQSKGKSQEQSECGRSATANENLCHAALKALQFLLKFAGMSLKEEEHKFLQETVVKLIVQVQRAASDPIAPFSAPSCRLELYTLLLELILQPCPKWPPPTHFAFPLLSRGLNDPSPQVSSFCSTALSMTTVIIHPQYSNGGVLLSDSSENRSQEVQLRWRTAPVDGESDRPAIEDHSVDSNGVRDEVSTPPAPMEVSPKEKSNNIYEDSDVSSNEDSRNTVAFTDSNVDVEMKSPNALAEDEPSPKIRRTEADTCPAPEDTPLVGPTATEPSGSTINQSEQSGPLESPTATQPCGSGANQSDQSGPLEHPTTTQEPSDSRTTECDHPEPLESPTEPPQNKTKGPDDSEPPHTAKGFSPEAEEGQQKKRYFLRSVTKGSSEEPEEAMRRTHSVDSLKSVSAKGSPRTSPSSVGAPKRPRTRALFKMESGAAETSRKGGEDEDEDILAAFDEALVD